MSAHQLYPIPENSRTKTQYIPMYIRVYSRQQIHALQPTIKFIICARLKITSAYSAECQHNNASNEAEKEREKKSQFSISSLNRRQSNDVINPLSYSINHMVKPTKKIYKRTIYKKSSCHHHRLLQLLLPLKMIAQSSCEEKKKVK